MVERGALEWGERIWYSAAQEGIACETRAIGWKLGTGLRTHDRFVTVGLLGIALCGVAVLHFATAFGIGLTPDSAAYIGAARGLLGGFGLGTPSATGGFSPMVLYAPLFATLLAAMGWAGIDPLEGARCVNSALFAASLLLSGRIIERETGSPSSALLGALLLLISVPMLEVHSMAWSEPTFLFLSLLALLWLSRYAERARTGWLIAAAVAVGLAVLSRYAGLSLVGAGIIAVIVCGRRAGRQTVRDCGIFAAISGFVSSAAFGRNWMVAGTPSGHPAAIHPVTIAQLQRGLQAIAGWLRLDPGPRRTALAAAAVGTCALVLRAVAQRSLRTTQPARHGVPGSAARTALIFVAAYGVFLLIAISFFDAPTQLDDRILAPPLAWALIGGISGAHRLAADPRRGRWARPLVVIAGMWFAVAQLLHALPWLIEVHRNGQGYAAASWQASEIVARVRALPPPTRIFSNGDDAIYLLTGRLAERIPERVFPTTTAPNDRYEAELTDLRKQLSESHGVVVYFSRIDWRPNLVSAAELQKILRLRALYTAVDGSIYTVQE
jgi:hypothetical protein